MENKVYINSAIYPMSVSDLEKQIGLPELFFEKLQEEDDWSFIIKLHALLEAACTQLLLYHFNDKNLHDIFSRLELSNKITGKIAFLKATELLSDEYRRYINALSELRNKLVHNVKNCNLNLKEMITEFDKNQLSKFAVDFSPFETCYRNINCTLKECDEVQREFLTQCSMDMIIKRAKDTPKFHIFIGAYNLLIQIIEMHGYSDYVQSIKAKKYSA